MIGQICQGQLSFLATWHSQTARNPLSNEERWLAGLGPNWPGHIRVFSGRAPVQQDSENTDRLVLAAGSRIVMCDACTHTIIHIIYVEYRKILSYTYCKHLSAQNASTCQIARGSVDGIKLHQIAPGSGTVFDKWSWSTAATDSADSSQVEELQTDDEDLSPKAASLSQHSELL